MMCRGVYLLRSGDETPRVQIQEVLAEELSARGLSLDGCRKKRFAERGFEPHSPLSRPRLLLVGEAAGIDPVTGEGIAQAIQYGGVAGSYLAEKLERGELEFDDWAHEVRRTMIGRDLFVRVRGVPLFYGGPRPNVERFLLETPEFIRLGLQHFAGKRWSRAALARAGWGALRHTAGWAVGRQPEPQSS
jgi:flavin-dependent dehydrogenase